MKGRRLNRVYDFRHGVWLSLCKALDVALGMALSCMALRYALGSGTPLTSGKALPRRILRASPSAAGPFEAMAHWPYWLACWLVTLLASPWLAYFASLPACWLTKNC